VEIIDIRCDLDARGVEPRASTDPIPRINGRGCAFGGRAQICAPRPRSGAGYFGEPPAVGVRALQAAQIPLP
jgi:hypothetical protein